MSSSLSSLQSYVPIAGLVATPASARHSRPTPPTNQFSRTLDSGLWRKQVCEVRPNRSSTLGRFPVAQSAHGGRVSNDSDDKTTLITTRLDAVSLPSMTKAVDQSLQRPTRAPQPPPRSSSDCCRCRWLRAASTSSLWTDPGRCRDPVRRKVLGDAVMENDCQEQTSYGNIPLPPPPLPLASALTSSQLVSSATSDFCVHVEQVDSLGARSGSTGCLLHAGSTHIRTVDVGPCSAAADGSARYCLEDITEIDETSTVDQSNTPTQLTADHQPVTYADPRRLATSCNRPITTFV